MHARALLVDVAVQYYGNNNGDLSPSWTLMRKRGWKSKDTLCRALAELRHYGFLDMTRQGHLHKASLYAITWRPVDECRGKLDVGCGPTQVASGRWKDPVGLMPKINRRLLQGVKQRSAQVRESTLSQ
jgi:hypothetical protein